MKKFSKILALAIALIMALSLSVAAFAATITKNPADLTGPASITVHMPTPQGDAADNIYKIYKVFDAVSAADGDENTPSAITYTLVDGKTTPPAGFTVDAQGRVTYVGTGTDGNLTDADINNIKGYVTDADLVATVNTTVDDSQFTVEGLPYGYYYITTTTGTVVTVDSTNPNADVNDKNEVPPVNKQITGATSYDEDGKKALAQVGTDVDFTATVTKKAGAEKYTYHDTMTSGLTYKPETLSIKVGGVEVPASNYTVTAPAGTETFKVEFKDSYIKTLADETDIVITYSATINESALTLDPEKNTAYLSYGNEDGENHTPPTEVEVYNAQISVNKENDKGEPLAGAGFVLQNAEGKYYKLNGTTVTWVDSIDEADEHFSADGENGTTKGAVDPFTGIANGTYTLIEKTVPGGYNKVGADPTFTIAEHDYTAENLEQSATVENESGVVLPSTGGIGTTIFYIVGAVLVVGAAVVLIVKRRTASANA